MRDGMKDSHNIHYHSDNIENFYRSNRKTWDQFYLSERTVLERLDLSTATRVLDIGCGCGGLGLALNERFGVVDYTGVEINTQAAITAAQLNPQARFFAADILALTPAELAENAFDLVVSLGCIDWNVEFEHMLEKAWRHVKPGGYFLSSFRLVPDINVGDLYGSFQYINFEGKREGEIAPYAILNARDLMSRLNALRPASIRGYGYWGAPSATAVTPFDRICFVVLAIEKPRGHCPSAYLELDLPPEILATL